MSRRNPDELACSFCHKPQRSVSKLISSPSDYPRAYICDECVTVCNSILLDDHGVEVTSYATGLLCHPVAAPLISAVETWFRADSSGADASAELSKVRELARGMFAE